ncbi:MULTISPECIES: GNAT family N-acetyltransferase [unclassified Microcoleus]|uniref:GNAT family N-acetyltransferase n=1 Tax=unclassified Microcoleus TaxID=2642155 RepID=UPI0025F83131|nr:MULTISPECIES: GNAT family N-acetyltransferase [unclassified Microcoleus]
MNILTTRSYKGKSDWCAIANLIDACEAVDGVGEEVSASEVKLVLDAPTLDKARDVQLWEDGNYRLIGLALLDMPDSQDEIDGCLWFYVHPKARGQDLEKDIIKWGEKRLGEVSKQRNLPAKLRTYSREDESDEMRLLEKEGFEVDRYFLTMARSLAEPIPAPEFPADFALTHVSGEKDIQPWVEMFNQSFIDHWNHHDLTAETVRYWMQDENYQPELDLIAVSGDRKFAAFCDCQIKPQKNPRSDAKDGWIELLGTRRDFRKMGLGKAMLLAGLHTLKAAGANTAKLSVDADSLTGATKLYKSVGFRPMETWLSWAKPV